MSIVTSFVSSLTEQVSRYFKRTLQAIASHPFYTAHVQLPDADSPIPPEIQNSHKFYPFFDGALGAIDGTHIRCTPSAADHDGARNRKGVLTQNCLAACSFDLRFTYVLSGWEGSTHDSTVYHDARQHDFYIPSGRYYLADAGFASSDALLVPYRNVRYHLCEWSRSKNAYVVHIFFKHFTLTFFQAHATRRSYSICVTHQLAMSSSGSLGSSSSVSKSSIFLRSMT